MPREKVEARERQLASPEEGNECTQINTKRSARRQDLSQPKQAWCRVLAAVADQREVLDFRIWVAEANDTHLEADVQIWCDLTGALADFLEAGRAA
jgi:hypothetical protein